MPEKTEESTQWAKRNFECWAKSRPSSSSDSVPPDLLKSNDPETVCKWMCCFIMETRKTDWSCYLPATLQSLVCGLNRELQRNGAPFSIMDKGDSRFRPLLKMLDSLSCELHKQGIGAMENSANVIEKEHEAIFWEKGLLGYTSPKVLQRTVFFYVGLNFALRGVQEQYELVPAQFPQFQRVPLDTKIYDESVYYQYTEFISKNNQHRFKDINARNKTSKAYMPYEEVNRALSS